MIYTFIGLHPFADGDAAERSDGSILDRAVVPLIFLLSCTIMAYRWRETLQCLKANIPVFLIVLFCIASVAWSDYPGLTLRRALLLFFITGITMGVAVSTTDIRRLHTMLFWSLVAVTLINLAGAVVVPSIANTDIGVRGLYTQKNVAGVVAMITAIIGATWIVGASRSRDVFLGLVALVPVFVFLVVSLSKTSINLTILGLFAIAYFSLSERYGPRFIFATIATGLLVIAAALAVLAIREFDLGGFLSATTGDASFSGRDELWTFARQEAMTRYWLGHGYGAFWDVGLVNDPLTRTEPGSWLSEVKVGVINQAHDGYLELWLNAGLPVTVLATLIIGYGVLSGAYKTIFGKDSRAVRAAFGGFTILLALHLLHNLTEATLFLRGANYHTTAMLALFLLSRSRYFVADPAHR